MQKATKILIVGLVLGGLAAGVGHLRVSKLEMYIRQLKTECAEESKRTQGDAKIQFQLICDPVELLGLETDPPAPGIQGKLVDAQRSLSSWQTLIFIGLGIFAFLSVPYCWYFLLRRIRELHDAIAGK